MRTSSSAQQCAAVRRQALGGALGFSMFDSCILSVACCSSSRVAPAGPAEAITARRSRAFGGKHTTVAMLVDARWCDEFRQSLQQLDGFEDELGVTIECRLAQVKPRARILLCTSTMSC